MSAKRIMTTLATRCTRRELFKRRMSIVKRKTVVQTSLLVSALVVGFGATGAQADTPTEATDTGEGVWAVVTDAGAVPVAPGVIDMEPPSSAEEPGGPTPYLIDFGQWVSCFTLNQEGMNIRNYTFYWNGEAQNISLLCGTDSYGYKHITNEHEDDWLAVQVAAGDEGADYSWDDLMSAGAEASITYPSWVTGPTSGKFCGEAEIAWFPNGDPNSVPTYTQRVLTRWSDTNKTVITSYPIAWFAPGC